MSIVKVAHASQSVLQFSRVRQGPILPTRSEVSTPQDSDTRKFITPEEQLQILDEHIYELRNLVAGLIAEDAYPDEDMRDYVAELRHSREKRDEIIHLMRELSRLQITEQPPRDYEEWIPWAHRRIRECSPKETVEKEPDYPRWQYWKKIETAENPPAKMPQKRRRKSSRRPWFLKIVGRQFSCVISFMRIGERWRWPRA